MTTGLGAFVIDDLPPRTGGKPKGDKSKENPDPLDPPKIPRSGSRNKPDLTPALMQIYVTIGIGLSSFPATRDDASVVFANAESAAKAVAKLADEKPEVYKAISKFLTAGAYAGIIAAHMPIIFGIMANHGFSNMPGMVTAEDDAA